MILSYLSNGLRVVSVRIKAIEVSKVADLMYFYDTDNAKEIAEEILKIDFADNYDGRRILCKLDSEFVNGLSEIIGRK